MVGFVLTSMLVAEACASSGHGSSHQPCADLHPLPAPCSGLQANRRIVWSEQPFWKQRYCPAHAEDGTPRCAGCDRLQPGGEEWGELQDSRQLCLSCLGEVGWGVGGWVGWFHLALALPAWKSEQQTYCTAQSRLPAASAASAPFVLA